MKSKKFWRLMYCIFAQKLPISYHFKFAKTWRRVFGRKILKYCGKNVNIERNAYFNEHVSLGDNSDLGVNCEALGPVTIGCDVMMGPDVVIYTRNHKHDNLDIPMNQQGFEEYRPVVISDDCWIGKRVFIMPGVTIGKGTIIGAGSVVTKSFPEYSVLGGVPAKLIKSRKHGAVIKSARPADIPEI